MSELSLQEVADRLGVHYMTAYKYVRMGKLHAEKQGASWVVLEEDLERFLTKPEAGEGSLASWSKDFEILIEQGPTWWQDSSRWENASVSWSPEIITIRADELSLKARERTPVR